jgi:hypothetical protein
MSRIAAAGVKRSSRRNAASPSAAVSTSWPSKAQGERQRLRGIVVVVDDEQARRPRPRRAARRRRWRGFRRRLGDRQRHREARPVPDTGALDRDRAAVQLDQVLGDRQAEAEAAARPLQRLLALDEAFEDARRQLRRQCRRPRPRR